MAENKIMNFKNIKKEIIIGTAQLQSDYGIANVNHDKNPNKYENFLSYAIENNYKKIDTAYAYKNAHKIIGDLVLKKKL